VTFYSAFHITVLLNCLHTSSGLRHDEHNMYFTHDPEPVLLNSLMVLFRTRNGSIPHFIFIWSDGIISGSK